MRWCRKSSPAAAASNSVNEYSRVYHWRAMPRLLYHGRLALWNTPASTESLGWQGVCSAACGWLGGGRSSSRYGVRCVCASFFFAATFRKGTAVAQSTSSNVVKVGGVGHIRQSRGVRHVAANYTTCFTVLCTSFLDRAPSVSSTAAFLYGFSRVFTADCCTRMTWHSIRNIYLYAFSTIRALRNDPGYKNRQLLLFERQYYCGAKQTSLVRLSVIRCLFQLPSENSGLTPRKNTTTPPSSPRLEPKLPRPQQWQQQQQQSPRVGLRLRPVHWPAGDSRGDVTVNNAVSSAALYMFLETGQEPGRNNGEKLEGRDDHLGDDYRFLADFDSGAVRLWQVGYSGGRGRVTLLQYRYFMTAHLVQDARSVSLEKKALWLGD